MKLILTFTFVLAIFQFAYSQNNKSTTPKNQAQVYKYAYITIEGKGLGKKLKVNVDLGDTPELINTGKEYSETLTNTKSYAAVLNYMATKQYELVESMDNSFTYQGIGGTSSIILIMRKKVDSIIAE